MALPIQQHLPAIQAALLQHSNLVLVAEPGAGKTTRVPRLLAEMLPDREVWVLQPRRLAARLAAQRVAQEWGTPVGEAVGYRVRGDDVTTQRTRLVYMTEGLLLRSLLRDRRLPRVGAVVFDEFHGRTLASDTALAALRHVQATERPDLHLVVMSATLDVTPVQALLDHPAVLEVPGRQYPVTVEHLSHRDTRPLPGQVSAAVGKLLRDGLDGDILVFLPGTREIQQAATACAATAAQHGVQVLPLHGSLTPAEQDRAVRPSAQRKLVLSTNVAETSVTLENVGAVVDSGLARTASHSLWSGMGALHVRPISQASAVQRAGRAGRTRAGRCVRLYTAQDFRSRPAHEMPEMLRLDLAETVLLSRLLDLPALTELAWVDPPPTASVNAAEILLQRVGALDGQLQLTAAGRRMADLPLHPRLARLVLEAETRGVPRRGCLVAALLSEGRLGRHGTATRVSHSDLPERSDDPQVQRLQQQLLRSLRSGKDSASDPVSALGQAVLAGFPDRVARRVDVTSHRNLELVMCHGSRVQLAEQSVVRDSPYLVALDAQERAEGGRSRTLVHLACGIEADWLLDLDGISEVEALQWNPQAERVEAVSQLRYDQLVLSESRRTDVDPAAAAPLLAKALQGRAVESLVDMEALGTFSARLQQLRRMQPDLDAPDIQVGSAAQLLQAVCHGCKSFAEVRASDPLARLQAQLAPPVAAALARSFPQHITLAGGRRLTVHYEADKPPWVESALQDFFGQKRGPTVADGRVPVTLHLLAPNRRAVQVTTDLEGFWQRHYPDLKKALSRRYPRHSWPDDPLSAAPPAPRRR